LRLATSSTSALQDAAWKANETSQTADEPKDGTPASWEKHPPGSQEPA
jgi:hypothetical protein